MVWAYGLLLGFPTLIGGMVYSLFKFSHMPASTREAWLARWKVRLRHAMGICFEKSALFLPGHPIWLYCLRCFLHKVDHFAWSATMCAERSHAFFFIPPLSLLYNIWMPLIPEACCLVLPASIFFFFWPLFIYLFYFKRLVLPRSPPNLLLDARIAFLQGCRH